jgi:hypothetical protein
MVLTLVVLVAGCSRPGAGSVAPTPTYITQPTPDPTMAAVVQGNAPQVAYLPPLEVKGSPTPVPAAGRSAAGGSRPAPKPAGAQREPTPARVEAAPKPAPTSAAPRPAAAPTAARVTNTGAGTAPTGPGPAPAIINPNTALPGGPVRPNPTPAR